MKKLLFLLALPCLLKAQTATKYDLAQDKKIDSFNAKVIALTNQFKSQNTRQYVIEYNDSINRFVTIPALKKQVSELQSNLSTMIGQNATLLGQYASVIKQMNEVQQVAVTALLEANKSDSIVFASGFSVDSSKGKKVVSVTASQDLTKVTSTALKATTDVADLTAKLTAAVAEIDKLKALNLKLKAQYP